MAHHYIATHSSGLVHLRKSERPYTHAAVGARREQASWASRHDLAMKSADQMRKRQDSIEVVAAVEVDSKEFARLTKASKRKFKAVFMGKTYTKTVDASYTGPMFAYGYDTIEHVERHEVPASWLQGARETLAYWENLQAKWGGYQDNIDSAKARIEQIQVEMARGYREVPVRGDTLVYFATSQKRIDEQTARHCSPGFRFIVQVECVEV